MGLLEEGLKVLEVGNNGGTDYKGSHSCKSFWCSHRRLEGCSDGGGGGSCGERPFSQIWRFGFAKVSKGFDLIESGQTQVYHNTENNSCNSNICVNLIDFSPFLLNLLANGPLML